MTERNIDIQILPHGLQPIVTHLGLAKTIAVLTHQQGQVMYIPPFPNKEHEVVKLFGLALVEEWATRYGVGPYQIPMLAKILIQLRNQEICVALDEKRESKLGLTRRFGLTRQHITTIYNAHLDNPHLDSQQLELGI